MTNWRTHAKSFVYFMSVSSILFQCIVLLLPNDAPSQIKISKIKNEKKNKINKFTLDDVQKN